MVERSLGFVKLKREFLNWEWYQNSNMTRIMLHIYLNANYTLKKWEGNTIKPGEFLTSMKSISTALKINESTVTKNVNKLIETGYITKRSTNHYTIIKLCDSDIYEPIGKQHINDVQTKEDRSTTTKKVNKENNIEERKNIFKKEIFSFKNFDSKTLMQFYDYWTEDCKQTGALRFEKETFWNTLTRLKNWKNYETTNNDGINEFVSNR